MTTKFGQFEISTLITILYLSKMTEFTKKLVLLRFLLWSVISANCLLAHSCCWFLSIPPKLKIYDVRVRKDDSGGMERDQWHEMS